MTATANELTAEVAELESELAALKAEQLDCERWGPALGHPEQAQHLRRLTQVVNTIPDCEHRLTVARQRLEAEAAGKARTEADMARIEAARAKDPEGDIATQKALADVQSDWGEMMVSYAQVDDQLKNLAAWGRDLQKAAAELAPKASKFGRPQVMTHLTDQARRFTDLGADYKP